MNSKSAKAMSLASKCGCQEKSVVYKTECRRVAVQNKGLGAGRGGGSGGGVWGFNRCVRIMVATALHSFAGAGFF